MVVAKKERVNKGIDLASQAPTTARKKGVETKKTQKGLCLIRRGEEPRHGISENPRPPSPLTENKQNSTKSCSKGNQREFPEKGTGVPRELHNDATSTIPPYT